MILLDTNVLSELTRPTPSVQVVTWLAVNEPSLAVPTIALAEVRYGISRLPQGRRRSSAGFLAGGMRAVPGPNPVVRSTRRRSVRRHRSQGRAIRQTAQRSGRPDRSDRARASDAGCDPERRRCRAVGRSAREPLGLTPCAATGRWRPLAC